MFYNSKSPKFEPKEVMNFKLDSFTVEEFLQNFVNNKNFFLNYHASRGDQKVSLPDWRLCEEKNLKYYLRTVKFLMRVKVGFCSKAKFVPIVHHNRLILLKDFQGFLWQQSFKVSGFIGADTILLVANLCVLKEDMNSISVKGAPIFVKNLTFIVRWKFREVGFSILSENFLFIEKHILVAHKQIKMKKERGDLNSEWKVEKVDSLGLDVKNGNNLEITQQEEIPKKIPWYKFNKDKILMNFLKFLFIFSKNLLNLFKNSQFLITFSCVLLILMFFLDFSFEKKVKLIETTNRQFLQNSVILHHFKIAFQNVSRIYDLKILGKFMTKCSKINYTSSKTLEIYF